MKSLLLSAVLLTALSTSVLAASQGFKWDYGQDVDIPAVSFKLYRQEGGCTGPYTTFTVPAAQATGTFSQTFTDSTLRVNRTYCMVVSAVGAGGEESLPSKTVTFSLPKNPAIPGNLQLVPTPSLRVK